MFQRTRMTRASSYIYDFNNLNKFYLSNDVRKAIGIINSAKRF